jgi:hypothetical protein
MRDDQHRLLSLMGQLPARLNVEQVATVLNCQVHDVPVLVAARLLKPLGNPLPNSVKYFATCELIELMKDRAWLARMTSALNQFWQRKNSARKSKLNVCQPTISFSPGEKTRDSVPASASGYWIRPVAGLHLRPPFAGWCVCRCGCPRSRIFHRACRAG